MKKVYLILPLVTLLAFTSCVQHVPDAPPITQLQIREIQTREFDTKDTKLVMKSMMNVLQDEGFIIKNAVLDLGLLSAEKNTDIENPHDATFARMWGGEHARWDKQQVLEASANISEYGAKTRVRMNFQVRILDNCGGPSEVSTIKNAHHYQDFFEKVSKGIFIQQENI